MELVFLEAASALRLTKQITNKKTTPYPHVRKINSHHYQIEKTNKGLKEFETLLRSHAAKGNCLLKGPLKKQLKNQSRAGQGDKNAYSDYIVLDIDNICVPGFLSKSSLTNLDIGRVAEIIITSLPETFHDVSYIAQASSSFGLKNDRVSLHIFMLLEIPLPVTSIKLWLKHINYTIDLFKTQLELSSNGQSLKYPLDPSVADNTKIIFIASPDFTPSSLDPFTSSKERILLTKRKKAAVDLAALMYEVNPEKNFATEIAIKDSLRKKAGLQKRSSKIHTATINNQATEVLINPDKMSITIVDESSTPFIRCNINGGDSNAYYFNIEDPTYMFNFKDEPIFEIAKADKDFYLSIFDKFTGTDAKGNKAPQPIVLRDFYTDTYYNGVFDPNLNQFNDNYPLTPTNKTSIEGFMRSHGRTQPDFVPDAQVVFEPMSSKQAVNLDKTPFYVNMYRKSQYMLNEIKAETPLEYGTGINLKDTCPMIYTLIKHILGNKDPETEHFLNWLAYIYQNKTKSMTAWILTGVPGTGKGVFINRILKPLFGNEHVPMKNLENIEEQFNLYMRSALFLIIDEFRMTDANGGSLRMADKLKNQITEPTLTIRGMRSNQIELPSYTNFIFLTNRPDAIKIETGDRRYNVGPRQEVKLEDAHPEIIENIDTIHEELNKFAGALSQYKVDKRMARICMNNEAKITMRNVTMSVFEEFCEAIKVGNLMFFIDVLDLSLDNTFNATTIMSAQRFVKAWIGNATNKQYSIIPLEHLRTVYHTQTEQTPQIAIKQFRKMTDRNGLVIERKRPADNQSSNPIRGVLVTWQVDSNQLEDIINQYFDIKDNVLIDKVNARYET
tara:strand:+ start:8149 stop:10671 length:2523 start_codon:yes stop_codon:yes gene_type:complete